MPRASGGKITSPFEPIFSHLVGRVSAALAVPPGAGTCIEHCRPPSVTFKAQPPLPRTVCGSSVILPGK